MKLIVSIALILLFTIAFCQAKAPETPSSIADSLSFWQPFVANNTLEDIAPGPVPVSEGCTPGFWKNHTDDWGPTGYSPSQTVESVFSEASSFPDLASATLLEALRFRGGPGAEGGARILLRAAVAALLNASYPNLDFSDAPESVILNTNAALDSGDRQTMLSLAAYWDYHNNLGCPVGR
jgi:hypothetical protein